MKAGDGWMDGNCSKSRAFLVRCKAFTLEILKRFHSINKKTSRFDSQASNNSLCGLTTAAEAGRSRGLSGLKPYFPPLFSVHLKSSQSEKKKNSDLGAALLDVHQEDFMSVGVDGRSCLVSLMKQVGNLCLARGSGLIGEPHELGKRKR